MNGAGAAAAYAAMVNAVKASGAIVRVEPDAFMEILGRIEKPLVVYSPAKFMVKHKYLTSYKGLCFYTKTDTPLILTRQIEVIAAMKIWVPD